MTKSLSEFAALQLPAQASAPVPQDIVIEVRRGPATITLRWPGPAAVHWARSLPVGYADLHQCHRASHCTT